jgi:serine/threonine protein kinase
VPSAPAAPGVVYRAIDDRLNRSVAIKVMPPEAVADPDRRQRFVREAIDGRRNVFSFGCVLREMLAGRPAFGGGNAVATLSTILTTEPVPLNHVCKNAPPELSARACCLALGRRCATAAVPGQSRVNVGRWRHWRASGRNRRPYRNAGAVAPSNLRQDSS